jgi:hypothetical protein
MLYVTKNYTTLFYINFKCCYSTFYELVKKGHLISLDNNGKCLNLALCRAISNKITNVYIIVRSPYSRLLSFYNDKFLSCFMNNISCSQDCQNNMYKYFNKEKIATMKFTFSDLVQAIKMGYSDPHIYKQANILRQRICGKPINILKLEDPEFNDKLSKLLNTEIPKSNSTSSVENKITINDITQDDKEFIYNIYKSDFITFNYTK